MYVNARRETFCPTCKKTTTHENYRQWGRRHDTCLICGHCLHHGDDAPIAKHFNSAAGRRERKAQWEAEAAARAARMALPVWER